MSSNQLCNNVETLIDDKATVTSDNGFILIWYDAFINEYELDYLDIFHQLKLVMKSIFIFYYEEKCLEFINEYNHSKYKLILLVSNSLAKSFIPKINHLKQIYSIYIFSGRKIEHEILTKRYSKVNGVFNDITELCKYLKNVKENFELNQICQTIVDVFEVTTLENFKHNDDNQPKEINVSSIHIPLTEKETISFIDDDIIQPSETVAPYMEYKQQMEFSDTGKLLKFDEIHFGFY